MVNDDKNLSNHIEEYFLEVEKDSQAQASKQIFQASDEDVNIKTELSQAEIILMNKLHINNDFLVRKGLKPVFKPFMVNYMKLKISLDRKSRQEFVNINKSREREILEQKDIV
ncbi:MAG: hypothetical protein ACLFVR_15695 [Thiohalospira sp.]